MIRVSVVVTSEAARDQVEAIATEISGEEFRLTGRYLTRDQSDAPSAWFADALLTEDQLSRLIGRSDDIVGIQGLAWSARLDSAESAVEDFKALVSQADGTSKFVSAGIVPPDLAVWAEQAYRTTL